MVSLISWHTRVNFQRPLIDAAGHAASLFEAIPTEPVGDSQAATTMMAVYDNFPLPVGFQFGDTVCQFAHGQKYCSLNSAGLIFSLFATIHEKEIVLRIQAFFDSGAINFDGEWGSHRDS